MSDTSASNDKRKWDGNFTDASTDGYAKWVLLAKFTAGTTPSWEDVKEHLVESILSDYVDKNPPPKNKVVEKKIKRRGWSKQFWEK